MAEIRKAVSFDEFSSNLIRFFDLVSHEHETLVVENADGEFVMVKPLSKRPPRRKAKADINAFLSAAGSWEDVDTDTFINNIYESRRRSNRPPANL